MTAIASAMAERPTGGADAVRTRQPAEWQPLLRALSPLVEACGATLVDADGRVLLGPGGHCTRTVPLEWEGRLVATVRLPDLHDALDRLVADIERQLGGPLRELAREDKRRAVRLLDERGAFVLRKSVEHVAERLGVSRFTVYNYLDRDAAE
jgi:hypothetical protein